jgi:hypothetical protein
VADTVINFELPWNPAKKNQRIGRIDRLGQLSKNLTVINLITKNSIETKIASGLTLKQSLFDGVLNNENGPDVVDFSSSGKAQFLQELESAMVGFMPGQTELYDEVPDIENQQVAETIGDIVAEENSQPAVTIQNAAVIERVLTGQQREQVQTMEKVMNHGMDFLAGMFKMATGNDIGFEGKKMEIDNETGEIVMRFKMPGF